MRVQGPLGPQIEGRRSCSERRVQEQFGNEALELRGKLLDRLGFRHQTGNLLALGNLHACLVIPKGEHVDAGVRRHPRSITATGCHRDSWLRDLIANASSPAPPLTLPVCETHKVTDREKNSEADLDRFIVRWAGSGGAERANYGLFLGELCRVLGVPEPEPTRPDDAENAYVFEKSVPEPHDAGRATVRRIDLYKSGCFVLEAKQGVEQEAEDEAKIRQALSPKGGKKPTKKGHGTRGTKGWDTFMQRARGQAESYVRLLPPGEGRPPFVLIADVGHAVEVYAEFTRTGGVYRPFPDVRSYRVTMEDLRRPEVRERLRAIWLEPLNLDPSLRAAEVTRGVAGTLARLSRSMEGRPDADGVPMTPERVSGFLIRMIFTMFAEDVGLIPEGKFRGALEAMKGRPEAFVPSVQDLWRAMAKGGYSVALQEQIKHFNGACSRTSRCCP